MIYVFDQYVIDTNRFELSGPDGVINAEPQILEFLIHMIRNRDQLLSKDALHEALWPGRIVSDAALSTLVRNARRLLGDSGSEQKIIETRHGRGFRFRADVTEMSAAGDPAEQMRAAHAQPIRVHGAPAIAVLPFEVMADNADTRALAESITEEVVSSLNRGRWFEIVARSRVRTFLDLPAVQRDPLDQLGAAYLVEGGVTRDGDKVRLHLHLTDCAESRHTHASRHDLTYTGLFALLDDVSTIVNAIVNPELVECERRKAAASDPSSLTGWQHFILGQSLITAPDREANVAARRHFEQSLEVEPDSGRILAGLAMTHLWDYKYDWSQDAEISLGFAASNAEKALALAPDDHWAMACIAICKLTLRRFDEALADARRAIEINPASALTYGCLSWVLAYGGQFEEALEAYDKATSLNSGDPRRDFWLTGCGIANFGLKRYEESLENARELIRLSPKHPSGYRMKVASLTRLGRTDEAREAARELLELLPHHDVDEVIARQPFRTDLGKDYTAALKEAGLTGAGSRKYDPPKPQIAGTTKEVRFVSNADGHRIAWSKTGSGPPVIAALGWMSNVQLATDNPFWGPLLRALSENHTLITFDHRGMGASDRDVGDFGLDELVRDLEAVVDAAGLERFAALGLSQGCAVTMAYMDQHPDQVSRLAMYAPFATGWRRPEWGEATGVNEAVVAVSRLGWEGNDWPFRSIVTRHILTSASDDQYEWIEGFIKHTISGANGARLVESMAEFDLRKSLASIGVPALVLHSEGDFTIPAIHSKTVAESIPDATYVEIASPNHVPMTSAAQWKYAFEAVIDFLGPDEQGVG